MRHLVYGLNPLISALREKGIRVEPLLRTSGINRKLLNNRPLRVIRPEFLRLSQQAVTDGRSNKVAFDADINHIAYDVVGFTVYLQRDDVVKGNNLRDGRKAFFRLDFFNRRLSQIMGI